MKKIRYLFFGSVFLVLCLAVASFYSPFASKAQVSYAAQDSTTTYNPLNYFSIFSNGEQLNSNNLTPIDGQNFSLMVNGSATVVLNPFTTRYGTMGEVNPTPEAPEESTEDAPDVSVEPDEPTDLPDNFKKRVTYITAQKPLPPETRIPFEYRGKAMYAEKRQRQSTQNLNVTETYYTFTAADQSDTSISMSTSDTDAINFTEWTEADESGDEYDYVRFEITDSYSLKFDNDFEEAKLNIDVRISGRGGVFTTVTLGLVFTKPVVRFADAEQHIVKFETHNNFNTETNTYDFNDSCELLQSEQTFNEVKVTFLNDGYRYTETNPLYFRINFNGFAYVFKLYSEVIDARSADGRENLGPKDYLIIRYTDEVAGTETQLATAYHTAMDRTGTEYIAMDKAVMSNEVISLTFNYRGRYQIEFYDNTYLQNIAHPNYYRTSFYLKTNSSTDESKIIDSKFNDMYILAQSLDENNNPIEYIVDHTILNNSVTVSLKNLTNLGDGIALSDIIDRIVITTGSFDSKESNTQETVYYPYTEERAFEEGIQFFDRIFSPNENGDYVLNFQDDNVYKIEIFSKNGSGQGVNFKQFSTSFQFTIMKKVKESFKPFEDQDLIDSASTPYTTESKSYEAKIECADPLQFKIMFNDVYVENESDKVLDITYRNLFTIQYGVKDAKINFSYNSKHTTLTFRFLGVGDMTVNITYKGETTTYIFNSEQGNNTIVFTSFGKYKVTLIDSMGTEPSARTVNFKKKLNTSAIVLIVLVSVIVVAITIFIIAVRGRIKTR